ncbi:MAG: phosphatidylserine decarboxylase family protein [Planctomycetes bacterium HGW-Planctomycetes-1]|nr:MAG: phosphatidylserine decarboxylase family protein [Planctomycetes bacterium HGW-Planctomycetes-1]
MKIPLTKYGLPQVVIFPGLCLLAMAAASFLAAVNIVLFWTLEVVLTLVLIWLLSFFRDPERKVPAGDNLILSPADGTVSDIEVVDESSVIGGKATRIGIFLSIFDAHLNRTPCAVKIEKITYHKGRFINAMNPESGKVNESNDIAMVRLNKPYEKILVRQISGAIARRIVCDAERGQEFAGGTIFGMIKFGSRTELYLPASTAKRGEPAESSARIVVKKGDKVKAGLTILAEYGRTD